MELLRALCLAQGGGAAHAQHMEGSHGGIELSGGEMPLQAARAGEGGGQPGQGWESCRTGQQAGQWSCGALLPRVERLRERLGVQRLRPRGWLAVWPGEEAASRACSCAGSESKAAPTP